MSNSFLREVSVPPLYRSVFDLARDSLFSVVVNGDERVDNATIEACVENKRVVRVMDLLSVYPDQLSISH